MIRRRKYKLEVLRGLIDSLNDIIELVEGDMDVSRLRGAVSFFESFYLELKFKGLTTKRCVVCNEEYAMVPSKQTVRQTCSRRCSGKLKGFQPGNSIGNRFKAKVSKDDTVD